jgi:hypothetical protein
MATIWTPLPPAPPPGVFRKIRPSLILWEPFSNISRHLVQLLAIWKQIANGAHSSVSGLLFTTYSCWQWRYEQIWNLFLMAQWTFKAQNVVILCRKRRYEYSAKLATAQWMLRDLGYWAMMPVHCTLRSVWIHNVFPKPTRSLSSLCVSFIVVNILLYIARLYASWRGGGGMD